MSSNNLHIKKALSLIFEIDDPKTTEVRLLQYCNAYSPIETTLFGITIFSKDVFSKARLPISTRTPLTLLNKPPKLFNFLQL